MGVRRPLLLVGLTLAWLLMAVAPLHAQGFTKLTFANTGEATAGRLRFHLSGPDDPSAAKLWEGPLAISHGEAHCEADASLIEGVYVSAGGKLALVVSISGSNTTVHFFSTATCAAVWPPIKSFTAGVAVHGNRLQLLPACACEEEGKPCSCTAGMVYRLSEVRAPMLLMTESRTLTKRVVGVGFAGERNVFRPRSKDARLRP